MTRVRFAPSPTGPLHIGGVRTALYNYLFARKMGGKMLLRIEDTDQNRLVSGAEQYIIEALQWAGIQIDEGQGLGGPHTPYKQSERSELYKKYAQQLLDAGLAYYAFDTAEELDALRKKYESQGSAFQYNAATRVSLKNSLTMPAAEVQAALDAGTDHVIRLKVPAKEEIRFRDIVRDWVQVHSSTIDDKVLMKSDGLPTYHLANVVDDHLMEITHVIRGEEWLPSAPLHVLLYKFFGWQAPEFAHLPLLLKPEGNGKLSKRDADLGGFPVFPLEWTDPTTGSKSIGFKQEGYLPEATINFLAFLGWNPGTEQEIFSMEQLIEAFSLERIGKAGAKFDIAKAKWFNHEYLKSADSQVLLPILKSEFEKANVQVDNEKLTQVLDLYKERVTFMKEVVAESGFLFEAPSSFTDELKVKWNPEASAILAKFAAEITSLQKIDTNIAKEVLTSICETAGTKIGKVMAPMRIAVTGVGAGPDLMKTIEILGSTETANRINFAIKTLG
jgi:glutamyl-tRNA synthetase